MGVQKIVLASAAQTEFAFLSIAFEQKLMNAL
jgi:hypothetical protein